MFRVCIDGSLSGKPEQSTRVAGKNHRTRGGIDIERLDGRDCLGDEATPLLGVEWRIGRKQAARGPEVLMAAARGGVVSIERRIGVEHFEVVGRRLLQR